MKDKNDGHDKEFVEFMMCRLGGEQQIRGAYYNQRIAQVSSDGNTLRDLLSMAEAGGWKAWLEDLSLADLAHAIVTGDAGEAEVPVGTRRLTAKQKADLHQKILAYLRENPWQQKNAIAEAVDFPSQKMGLHLRALRQERRLKTTGVRAATRYALYGEKAKVK